jgi:hypothetical protein
MEHLHRLWLIALLRRQEEIELIAAGLLVRDLTRTFQILGAGMCHGCGGEFRHLLGQQGHKLITGLGGLQDPCRRLAR